MPQVYMESLASNTSLTVARRDATPDDVDGDPNYHIAYGTVEVPAVGWSLRYRVYDREESTKGATNPKSRSLCSDRFSCSNSNPNSLAASKNKPPIIALPRANVQAASAYDGRSVRRPTQCRFFPKDKKKKPPAVPDAEPGSPKVSCVGKILSEKERCRLRRKQGRKKTGWANLFQCIGGGGGGRREGTVVESAVVASQQGLNNLSLKGGAVLAKTKTGKGSASVDSYESVVVPGVDAMKRLSSGRRAASWGEQAELKGNHRRSACPDE